MSQHIISDGTFEYVLGWDQPLQSFYLQKHDPTLPEDEQIVAWLGASADRKMYEVEDLVREARKLGLHIDSVLKTHLYNEKDNGE